MLWSACAGGATGTWAGGADVCCGLGTCWPAAALGPVLAKLPGLTGVMGVAGVGGSGSWDGSAAGVAPVLVLAFFWAAAYG